MNVSRRKKKMAVLPVHPKTNDNEQEDHRVQHDPLPARNSRSSWADYNVSQLECQTY